MLLKLCPENISAISEVLNYNFNEENITYFDLSPFSKISKFTIFLYAVDYTLIIKFNVSTSDVKDLYMEIL